MTLSRVVSEIFKVEIYCDLEIPAKGHSTQGTIRQIGYDFLLVFCS